MLMKHYVVNLSDSETAELRHMTTQGGASANRALHARILLKSNDGLTDEEIREALDVSVETIERVRKRCVLEGLTAALVRKKQENPRVCKLDGTADAQLVQLACSTPPEGRSRWTLHLLAEKLVELKVVESISHETIRQQLKKKRAQALEGQTVLHPARKERRIRVLDGRRSRGFSPSVGSKETSDLPR